MCAGVVNFLSAPIVTKIGVKKCLMIGGIGYSFFLLSYTLPLRRKENPNSKWLQESKSLCMASVILGSVIGGVGSAIVWAAQGKYISDCANEQNAGKFNAVFWTFFSASQLVGSLMGAYMVTQVNLSTFFLMLTSISLVSLFVFLPLTTPVKSGQAEKVEDSKVSETWKLAKSRRMLVFIPIFLQGGLIIAFRTTFMVQMFTMTMDKSNMKLSTQHS